MCWSPSRLLLIGLPMALLASKVALCRELSFQERVEAQRAIERVYYSHQVGATRPFSEAVPESILQEKVLNYQRQSVALERFWGTWVTPEMLRAELQRMSRETRMPGRLLEIFSALGMDTFLAEECLARPALV